MAYYNHFVLHDFDTARTRIGAGTATFPNNADAILELSYIDRVRVAGKSVSLVCAEQTCWTHEISK